jgi:ATP synthase protein I
LYVIPVQTLHSGTRRLLALQCCATALAAVAFLLASGQWDAVSAIYGGLIGVLMTLLLSRGVALAGKMPSLRQSQIVLYAGAVVRFILVLALFAIGLAAFDLAPLALVLGFVAAQLVFPFTALTSRGRADTDK